MTHVYRWRNNPRRAELYGRRCRILMSGKMGTVLVEFENGELVTTSRRALRRETVTVRAADADPLAGRNLRERRNLATIDRVSQPRRSTWR